MTVLVLIRMEKFKLSASAAASEFCEWVQVGIDVYIPHHKYLVKLHSCPWFWAACATAIVHRNYSFCFYQHNKPSDSKVKFRQATNALKRVQTPTKTKESVTSQKRGSWGFWWIVNSVLKKGKSATPLFSNPEVLSFGSDKAKLFAETFSRNSNFGGSGRSLPVLSSRTNQKLHISFFNSQDG